MTSLAVLQYDQAGPVLHSSAGYRRRKLSTAAIRCQGSLAAIGAGGLSKCALSPRPKPVTLQSFFASATTMKGGGYRSRHCYPA